MFRYIAMAALCAPLLAQAAWAQPTVDQFQLSGADQTRNIHSAASLGQSFLVGADGFLVGVELSLTGIGASAPLRASIYDAPGGVPTALRLGEVHLTAADLADSPPTLDGAEITATYIDFSSFAIAVSAGDELAIQLETTAPSTNGFGGRLSLDSAAYADGSILVGGAPSSGDLAFKTFIVDDMALAQNVDQYQLNGFDQARALLAGSPHGQTFIAGTTGQLEGLELILGGIGTTEPLLIEILDISAGLDGAPVLGHVSLDGAGLIGNERALHRNEVRATFIDLKPQHIVVVAGDLLAFRLSTDNTGPGLWSVRRSLADLYSGGSTFSGTNLENNLDLAFKTFVADPVFADDFETGDLARWNEVVQP